MAHPQPDNQEQPKYLELAAAYNAIEHKRFGSFQLRSLAKQAEYEYRTHADLAAGLIWATCLFDMGKLQQSETLFKELTAKIPLDTKNELAINLYSVYARILAFTDHLKEAISYLDSLWDGIPELSLETIHVMMGIYTDAGLYEKAMYLHAQAQKRSDDQTKRDTPIWPLMVSYWSNGNVEALISLLNTYAIHVGFEKLTINNLDAVMDRIANGLVEPNFKPHLTGGETRHLEAIHKMALTSGHLEEQDPIHDSKPVFFDDTEALQMLEGLMDDYDSTFRELAL